MNGEKLNLKRFLLINLGILMIAVGIYFFKTPNGFALGGVSGLSLVLSRIPFSISMGITQATYMLVINVFLLILGFILLGRSCGILTAYCALLLSVENMLFEWLVPLEAPLTPYPLLELVFAVLLAAIGSALLFNSGASSGGTDIVALIIKKFAHTDVGAALLAADVLIALSSFFVFGVTAGLFSILGLFAKAFITDDVLDSIQMCKSFMIITTHPQEINDFIVNNMHHGATVYNASGAFTGEDKQVIITVCKKSEAYKLKSEVKKIDPHAFIIITKSSEIMGKGFRSV
jgi:uncharacterized membrane-anchored protein YitT (DUF2179 family)